MSLPTRTAIKAATTGFGVAVLLVLLSSVSPDHADAQSTAQGVDLFAVSNQDGVRSTNEVFRYEVTSDAPPVLELTLTDASLDRPVGLAFSPWGEMFVVNRTVPFGQDGSVSRFLNPQGTPLPNGTIESPSFAFPHWAAFRGDELFVVNSVANNLLRFVFAANGDASLDGTIAAGLGGTHPRGITVNPVNGEVFVTECCGVNEINRYVFDAFGNAVPNGVIIGGGLNNPHDMAFSPWGELFVANFNAGTVSRFVFDSSGNATPNGQLSGNGLRAPLGLDFSPWGELFVSNQRAAWISRWQFDASLNGVPNGTFSTPVSLGDIQFLNATAAQRIQGLVVTVESLVADGPLNRGQGRSLSSKLEAALASLKRDRDNAAVHQLAAFANEVQALVDSGRLSEQRGQPLIDEANSIIDQILGS